MTTIDTMVRGWCSRTSIGRAAERWWAVAPGPGFQPSFAASPSTAGSTST